MTEQQYRVAADRDHDDVYGVKREPFDRVTYGPLGHDIVRIERPVPTEHCLSTAHHDGHEWAAHEGQPGTGYWCPGFDAAEEHPPTREQIAEALWREENAAPSDVVTGTPWLRSSYFNQAAAVLALLQKGADQ